MLPFVAFLVGLMPLVLGLVAWRALGRRDDPHGDDPPPPPPPVEPRPVMPTEPRRDRRPVHEARTRRYRPTVSR
ncbi:MAG TPA: hypothetical protein VK610_03135 [Rhodothermales bacterium]|nr:hypothetical protein [Rhodothermales bacterium]